MPVVYDRILHKEKQKLFKPVPYITAAIPACVLIAVYFIFRSNMRFAEAVVNGFALPARRAAGYICSFVPFSVTELLFIAVAAAAIAFICRTVLIVVRSDAKLLSLLKRVLILVIILLYYYASFCFLWKFDYYSPTFAEKSGLFTTQFTTDELIEVASYFAEHASLLASEMERDENGNCDIDVPTVFTQYEHLYDGIQSEFSFLQGDVYRPKPMRLFSQVMSRTGFTGLYVSYTGESNININAPSFTIPCTISHELAHQLGVYAEDEANFVGILACAQSDNDIYAYSGYFSGTIHLLNALYEVDRDAWDTITSNFSDELWHDWNYNNSYWADMESSVSEAASEVYDEYLKSNGQDLGIASYSNCVILLVNYFMSVV